MPLEVLKSFLTILLEQIPEETSPRVIVVKADLPPQSPRPNGSKTASSKRPAYDPSQVYVLELATVLATRDRETVEEVGKDVAGALQTIIRDASNTHPVVVSRAAYYLLALLRTSNEFDFIRAPVALHAFSSFGAPLLKQCASFLLRAIHECISGPSDLRNEMANSPDFWSIIGNLHNIPEAAQGSFQVIEELAVPSRSGISANNYEAAVGLLNEFATAASIGARQEQIRNPPRGRAPPPGRPKPKAELAEVVQRGVKAMTIIYQITNRVPYLIEQSHLESNEGQCIVIQNLFKILM